MKKRLAAGGVLVAAALWFQIPAPLIIHNDRGGNVEQRVHQIEQLRKAGTRVQIRGRCDSACTMFLGLPRACVARTARLGFHGPQSQYYGISLSPANFERWSRVMAGYYPPRLRSRFMAEWRQTTMGLHVITGAEAIRMGARACK